MFCDKKCLNEALAGLHGDQCVSFDEFFEQDHPDDEDDKNVFLDPLKLIESRESVRSLMKTRSGAIDQMRLLLGSLNIVGSVDRLQTLFKTEPKVETFDWTKLKGETDDQKKLEIVSKLKSKDYKYSEEMVEDCIAKFRKTSCYNKFIKSEDDLDIVKKYAKQVFDTVQNNFSIIGGGKFHGGGVLPYCSLFNHSCDPNVEKISFGNKFAFIVLKPIEKNEQLFFSYE
jgi:hypothetical protein